MTTRKRQVPENVGAAKDEPLHKGTKKFVLKVPDDIRELYVDGVSAVAVGLPDSKILFHTVRPFHLEGSDEPKGPEERHGVLVLTIQTATLIEMCKNILEGAIRSEDQLEVGHRFIQERLQKHLAAAKLLGTVAKAKK